MDKLIAKFRKMALTARAEAERRRMPRQTNTPKRAREDTSQRIDADHYERVAKALEKLADARECGTLDPVLAEITTKDQLMSLLRRHIDTSGGYYSIRDTHEYVDESVAGKRIQYLITGALADANDAAMLRQIDEMIKEVRFENIPGFFPTPDAVISHMLTLAGFPLNREWPLNADYHVLEPSAGIGSIADAVQAAYPYASIDVIEKNQKLELILKKKGYNWVCDDFLEYKTARRYQRILLNPPFEKGADIAHVQHAFSLLASPGLLVSVMSNGPFFREDRKAVQFRHWFTATGGVQHELPDDAFKNAFRSTGTKVCLVVIRR
jgi:hypothetical protein